MSRQLPIESTYFTYDELSCSCCGVANMKQKAIIAINDLRYKLQRPLIINSAYRCPKHNKAVGGVPDSQHVKGTAFDVRKWEGMDVDDFIAKAEACGFNGIGLYNTFIHIDVRPSKARWKG